MTAITYEKLPFVIPVGRGNSGKTTILNQSTALILNAVFNEPERTTDYEIKDVPIYNPNPEINEAVKFQNQDGLVKYFSANVMDIAGNPTKEQANFQRSFFHMARGKLYVVDGDMTAYDESIKTLQPGGSWYETIKVASQMGCKYDFQLDAGYISKMLTNESIGLKDDVTEINPNNFKKIIDMENLEDAIKLFEDKKTEFIFIGDAIIGPKLYAYTPDGLIETSVYAAYTVPMIEWLRKDGHTVNDKTTNYINTLRYE